MFCKTCKKSKHGETRSKTNDFRPQISCILQASESTRMRVEESLRKYHEDHIAGKGDNSLQHYNLVHKFIPMPQAMKNSSSKGSSGQEARVAWKVVLYCSNRASICSHALILLTPTRWIVMTGWRTSISLQPFVQTRGSLLYTSTGLQPCVSKPFELWILVCVHASVSAWSFKHVWMGNPCLSISICLQPCVSPVLCSNTFGLWFLVCVHAPINSLLFQTPLIVVACLLTSISLEPKWLRVTWCSMLWEWRWARARLLRCPYHFRMGQTET